MEEFSSQDEALVDRLVEIDRKILEMMDVGLKGGRVDVKQLKSLQDEVTTLREKMKGKPELIQLYNKRVSE